MRLNKRGRRVRAALVTALVIALIYALSALIWYTPQGYCLGTMSGCVGI
jgi:ABC-type dipeptide/oligopeptide/nickel transport system permease subunit